MSINIDYAQLNEWGKLNKFPLELPADPHLYMAQKPYVKPLDKVVDEVFKPIIIQPEEKHDNK